MKKLLLGALLILSGVMFSHKTPVFAENNTVSTQTEVLTFLENQNQYNVGNISEFAINDSNIFYVNNTFNQFNTVTKTNYNPPYENVTSIKQTENYIGFLSNGYLKLLKNSNEITVPGLNEHCDFFNLYEQDGNLYISYVKDSTLHFIKINSDLEIVIERDENFGTQQIVATCLTDTHSYLIVKNSATSYGLLKVDNLTFQAVALPAFNHLNCTGIELIVNNNENYFILTTSLNQKLVILKEVEVTDGSETYTDIVTLSYTSKQIEGTQNVSFSLGELSEISDVKWFNSKIYVADSLNKNIQAFNFNFEDEPLTPSHIVLTSSSFEAGYFKNVNDFCVIDNNNLLISDTGHNRLQTIKDGQIEVVNSYLTTTLQNPKHYLTSNNQTFYFYNNGKLIKQTGNNIVEVNIGSNIADLKVDAYNNIYYLDYNLNKLITIKSNKTTLDEVIINLNLNQNSKLEILNEGLVINTNNSFTYYNFNGESISNITLPDPEIAIDFTSDFYGSLYVLTTTGITKIENIEGVLSLSTTLNYNTTNLTLIRFNKVTGDLIAYNNHNCNFIKISNSNFASSLSGYSHLCNPVELEPQTTILESGTVNKNTYIYQFPYSTGLYKQFTKDTIVFVLGEIENSYYIMFNSNNTIDYGYIHKTDLSVTTPDVKPINKVTVINKNIKLYKLPTILRDGTNSFAYTTMQLNTELNVVNFNLNSIDNSEYFAVLTNDNKILYVNSSDVTLSTSTDIAPLPDLNAEVLSTNGNTVKLYSTNNTSSSVILELKNNQKVYVENYDSTKEFTYITVITESKEEVSGYVLTKNLKLIENNPNLTSAYILLGVAILIGVASILIYVKYKKSND